MSAIVHSQLPVADSSLAILRFVQLNVLWVGYFEIARVLALWSGSRGLFFELKRQLPGQLAYFVAGALGYYYLPILSGYGWQLSSFVVLAFALRAWLPWAWIGPLAFATLVVTAACLAPGLGNFGTYGHFPYSIYILHFPLLQVLVAFGLFDGSAVPSLLGATVLLLVLAVVLRRFVEQPWLQRSSHYRSAIQTVAQA